MAKGTLRRVGTILLWVAYLPLLFFLLPVVLYVTFAGGSVNVPMGFGGCSFGHRGRSLVSFGHQRFRWLPLSSRMVGLDLEDRGYRHIADMDYPFPPRLLWDGTGEGRAGLAPQRIHPVNIQVDTHVGESREMSERRRWGIEGPPPEAYSRVTDAERFRPLHPAMLEIIGRLDSDFEVERTEGYGLDEELKRDLSLAGPCVRLSPRDTHAAPIAVAFSAFPGLHVRFGRWHTEPFPVCGCDACDESAKDQIERLTKLVDEVITGGFCETIENPLIPFIGHGWTTAKFWSPVGSYSSGSRLDGLRAREMSGGRLRLDLDWKPWSRRYIHRVHLFGRHDV